MTKAEIVCSKQLKRSEGLWNFVLEGKVDEAPTVITKQYGIGASPGEGGGGTAIYGLYRYVLL